MKYLIIRPTTVFGPRDKAGMAQMLKSIVGNYFIRIGNGENIMDYVYVKRLVSAVVELDKHNVSNEDFIVGANRHLKQKDMVRIIFSKLNKSYPNFYLPKKIALILSFIAKYLFKVFGKRSPIFPNRVKVLTSNCYFNTTKLQKTVQINPAYNFENGISETIKWEYGSKVEKKYKR